jgi:DNA-binding response OmpR family regulator
MFDYALRMSGFAVSAVPDGFRALRSIEQQLPDVVVLDLDLPQVSGVDVHQEIMAHAETRAIPIIVVTGTNWHTPAGVFRTLRKPIASDVLVGAVERALSHATEQAGGDGTQRYTGG